MLLKATEAREINKDTIEAPIEWFRKGIFKSIPAGTVNSRW